MNVVYVISQDKDTRPDPPAITQNRKAPSDYAFR